jgi:hypothetical protein
METGMSWERKELVQEGCCVGWRELRVEGVEVLACWDRNELGQ